MQHYIVWRTHHYELIEKIRKLVPSIPPGMSVNRETPIHPLTGAERARIAHYLNTHVIEIRTKEI